MRGRGPYDLLHRQRLACRIGSERRLELEWLCGWRDVFGRDGVEQSDVLQNRIQIVDHAGELFPAELQLRQAGDVSYLSFIDSRGHARQPSSDPGFGQRESPESPSTLRRSRWEHPSGLRILRPMPELPEVEVTRRRIGPLLVGRRIARVRTTPPSYFYLTHPSRVRRALEGRTVLALERLGKYLVASLDDERRLVLHLGMTGQLFSSAATSVRLLSATTRASLSPEAQQHFEPDLHTHLELQFDDGAPGVCFRDVRKFGKVLLLEKGHSDARLDRLGVDALEITGDALFTATRSRRAPIKSVLLDQRLFAGIGNIYADEALFHAGVRPRRAAGRLSRDRCQAIARALRRVLERSIETGGSSISDFVQPDGQDGHFQDERCVYARTGLPCRTCGAPIVRVVVGQRGTHYCPNCQR